LSRRRIKKEQRRDFRLDILTAVIFLIGGVIFFRLFTLQILNHDFYAALASNQHQIIESLMPERGQIFARDKYSETVFPLASNQKLTLVYAIPKYIKNREEFAAKLAPILEMDKEAIAKRIDKENDLYEPLKNKVTDEKVEAIKRLNLKGAGFTAESWRVYPEAGLASHILGFVGYDGDQRKGRYGLEGYYEEKLAGAPGFLEAEKDVAGRWISIGKKELKPAQDGDDLILTIDRAVQYKAEAELAKAVEKWSADSGTIIVLDPQSGGILAMANNPNYNNNDYAAVSDVNVFNNNAIFENYEPGSSFKPICMAIGVGQGIVSPQTTYTDTGAANVGGYTIRNYDNKIYGLQTMTNVLEKSINTGMVFVNQQTGAEKIYQGLVKFGFNELSGIDLDTELQTALPPARTWRTSNLATIGFGQGIAVTPIQLVAATAGITNGGKILAPHVVAEIVHHASDGQETREVIEPKVAREAIDSATAATLSAMLVSSMENGFAKAGRIPGYHLGGKTGTAQVPLKNAKGYEPDKVITSFIGFGPIEDPRFVILVKLNNPKSSETYHVVGENTAGPVFRELAQFLVNYYQIAPSE